MSPKTPPEMFTEALHLRRLGLSVIAIHAPGMPLPTGTEEDQAGKMPLIPWKEYQTRLPTEEEVQARWNRWPNANIGVVTGAVSGVLVLDVDGKEGAESLKQFAPVPVTWRSTTGRGEHLWFKHPGGVIRNFARRLPGLDLRGDGGFVVAPPSTHRLGSRYGWTIPPEEAELADPPAWLLELTNKQQDVHQIRNPDDWENLLQGVPEGQRHEAALRIAGHYFSAGWGPREIETLLVGWAMQCVPPFDVEEIKRIVRDLAAKDATKVAQILSPLGFLGDNPTPEAVEGALRRIVVGLKGADRLKQKAIRERVVERLKQLNVPSAAGFVDAAFNDASQRQDKSDEPTEKPDIESLRERCASILQAADPFQLMRDEIKALGFGGDSRPVEVTYLSGTTRLLKLVRGAMPAHLQLLAQSGTGKNYTMDTALSLFPSSAYHRIDAGSPRVLIYDSADLEHRIAVFGEADSIPRGEDNPAASAIRNLAQDHYLHYKVVVKDPESGNFTVKDIVKPGPSVLVTTAVKSLGQQLGTRTFIYPVSDDPGQIGKALEMRGEIEEKGVKDPDPALVAYQEYLQALAPWDVVVPFATALSRAIRKVSPAAPRILRDYNRLLSLIKAVAILRHQHRRRGSDGRLVAELEDYETVRELIQEMYVATVTELSQGVREAIEAVRVLRETGSDKVTVKAVADHLGVHKMTAHRRVGKALWHGWLTNSERRNRPADLALGEPLPAQEVLPASAELEPFQEVYADTPEIGVTALPLQEAQSFQGIVDNTLQSLAQNACARNTPTKTSEFTQRSETVTRSHPKGGLLHTTEQTESPGQQGSSGLSKDPYQDRGGGLSAPQDLLDSTAGRFGRYTLDDFLEPPSREDIEHAYLHWEVPIGACRGEMVLDLSLSEAEDLHGWIDVDPGRRAEFHSLLRALEIRVQYPNARAGTCPLCGYPKPGWLEIANKGRTAS